MPACTTSELRLEEPLLDALQHSRLRPEDLAEPLHLRSAKAVASGQRAPQVEALSPLFEP